MRGLFDLVEDGNCEVLAAYGALALVVLDQVIEVETELARPLAGLNGGGGRDRCPIEVAHLSDNLERECGRLRGRRLYAFLGHVLEMSAPVLADQAASP